MSIKKNNIYLIGIGGIGMSALARYFNSLGKNVAGYDKVATPLTEQLEKEGIVIHYEDDPEQIPEAFRDKGESMVIFTPAVPSDHQELKYFRSLGFRPQKRSQVLGQISKKSTCLAVAGTHGKTTTSSLLTHIFRSSGQNAAAFLGGISVNYQSNFLSGEDSDIVITEADEYDKSFLQLAPHGAIITSLEADHLDIYEDAKDFKDTFRQFHKAIVKHKVVHTDLGLKGITYGIEKAADFIGTNLRIEDHSYLFDLITPDGKLEGIKCGVPGVHNVENAVAAWALASQYGFDEQQLRHAIESFKGVKRRFEYHINSDERVYIDDYAHHPTEINAFLGSVKQLYPELSLLAIFQPHLYSRTRDFMDEFAGSLELADEVILMDIYPAREKPIPGVSSRGLLDKISIENKSLMNQEEIVSHIKKERPRLVVTIGAGDIDKLVNPIKMAILNA